MRCSTQQASAAQIAAGAQAVASDGKVPRRASRLHDPGPIAANRNMPPATEMFFMNSRFVTIVCSAGTDQKGWKMKLTSIVNRPRPSAAQRV
jgi:hypothetical protein